jgi:hypothetical protein
VQHPPDRGRGDAEQRHRAEHQRECDHVIHRCLRWRW